MEKSKISMEGRVTMFAQNMHLFRQNLPCCMHFDFFIHKATSLLFKILCLPLCFCFTFGNLQLKTWQSCCTQQSVLSVSLKKLSWTLVLWSMLHFILCFVAGYMLVIHLSAWCTAAGLLLLMSCWTSGQPTLWLQHLPGFHTASLNRRHESASSNTSNNFFISIFYKLPWCIPTQQWDMEDSFIHL